MKRFILLTCSVLLALSVAVSPAYAGEKLEGDGYVLEVPSGFVEAMSLSGSGDMKITSKLGNLPIDGMPEVTVFIAGLETEPRGTIMVSRVDVKSGHEIESVEDLGMDQIQLLQSRMGEGFSFKKRKVGEYDAVEIMMEADATGEEHTVRILSIACGEFIVVVMMQTLDGEFPAAQTDWNRMVESVKIDKGLPKVVLYGAIALGVTLLLIVLMKVAGGGGSTRQPLSYNQFEMDAYGASSSNVGYTSPYAETGAQQTAAAPPPPPPSPVGNDGAGPGLVSTLPPSGRWSDGNSSDQS